MTPACGVRRESDHCGTGFLPCPCSLQCLWSWLLLLSMCSYGVGTLGPGTHEGL